MKKMDIEIQVAVQFMASFLDGKISQEDIDNFSNELRKLLSTKFEGHWYPDKPAKGSAYRCLSIEENLDTVIIKAAENSKVKLDFVKTNLPKKLDLWIDPTEVSYRVGEHGMVIVIYKEGDDCINSTSEYLAKVLNQLPTVSEKEFPKKKDSTTLHQDKAVPTPKPNSHNFTQLANSLNISVNQRRLNNHLSPSAKSFVSRKNNALNLAGFNIQALQPNLNHMANLDYIRKLQNWPLIAAAIANGAYDPLTAQLLQNYLVVQELQRFETQRLALQSHLLKMHNLNNRWSRKSHQHRQHNQHTSSSSNSGKGLQVSV